MQFQFPHCEICHDTRHIRTGVRTVRLCECIAQCVNIKPLVRGGEFRYPDKYDRFPPFPLRDVTVGGGIIQPYEAEYTAFRYMVWRSLLSHTEMLTYEYLNVYRLCDMQFGKDATYDNPRDMAEPDLLIIALALADVPNKLAAPLLVQVLTLRREWGKPTWIYSPMSVGRVRDEYSAAVADMVGVPKRVHP